VVCQGYVKKNVGATLAVALVQGCFVPFAVTATTVGALPATPILQRNAAYWANIVVKWQKSRQTTGQPSLHKGDREGRPYIPKSQRTPMT